MYAFVSQCTLGTMIGEDYTHITTESLAAGAETHNSINLSKSHTWASEILK
jgi:hypothetical protein